MEIFKALHLSVAEACEASFDEAYRKLESEMTAHKAKLQEAQNKASFASKAQQEAEEKIEILQREVSALKDELETHDDREKTIECPDQFEKLEAEFAPDQVWSGEINDIDHLRGILESKYRTLYSSISTFNQSWCSLKARVLQHKKKLQHWDKQLHRDRFTLIVDGHSVTFQKVQKRDTPCPHTLATQSQDSIASKDTAMKSELHPSQSIPSLHSTSSDTQSPSENNETPELPNTLPTVPPRKRRRITASPNSKTTTGNPNPGPVVRVKNEPVSSSPVNDFAGFSGLQIPSTQDLDEIGDTVQTPTKRRTQRQAHWDDTPTQGESTENSHQPNVLQQLDVNVRRRNIRDYFRDNWEDKRVDKNRYLVMTEDGDSGGNESHAHPQMTNPKPGSKAGPKKSGVTQGRLQGLLESPGPSRSPIGDKSNGSALHGRQSNPSNTVLDEDSRRAGNISRQPGSSNGQEFAISPEEEPFRSRPIHRLTLENFKLNPKRNQGLDYAYDAVVRKRDERKCLPGCTRPECCGDRFRAMARLGGLPAKSPAEQHEEDQKVLEDYMGDDFPKLKSMSIADREDILVEARARALANQYGRHRNTHQRAQTPPGFWRTDMPSTQELESDREIAKQLDRQRVEDRYREAMRPGGLWTWADE